MESPRLQGLIQVFPLYQHQGGTRIKILKQIPIPIPHEEISRLDANSQHRYRILYTFGLFAHYGHTCDCPDAYVASLQ